MTSTNKGPNSCILCCLFLIWEFVHGVPQLVSCPKLLKPFSSFEKKREKKEICGSSLHVFYFLSSKCRYRNSFRGLSEEEEQLKGRSRALYSPKNKFYYLLLPYEIKKKWCSSSPQQSCSIYQAATCGYFILFSFLGGGSEWFLANSSHTELKSLFKARETVKAR